ncbi:hypothetical protein ACJX0J_024746, partial [Zea mays]
HIYDIAVPLDLFASCNDKDTLATCGLVNYFTDKNLCCDIAVIRVKKKQNQLGSRFIDDPPIMLIFLHLFFLFNF